MAGLTRGLRHWLSEKYPDIAPEIIFGRYDLVTPEMELEYAAWVCSDEGIRYLKSIDNVGRYEKKKRY